MFEQLIVLRNTILRWLYLHIAKPIFFKQDPEKVHDRAVRLGRMLGATVLGRLLTRMCFYYQHPILRQTIHGIVFPNPVGLAAGFDKDAQLTTILPDVGFGFEEIGSITGQPCAGNTGKRLWRLPKSRGLVVYYGLKNQGCEAIARRLQKKKFRFPVGVSIAKTNSPDTCQLDQGIADYAKAFEVMKDIGEYITINISCPNAYGGEPFSHPERLEKLLTRLDEIEYDKPIFIKLAADHTTDELDELLDVALRHRVHGFVCTNLAKDRNNPNTKQQILDDNLPEVGGLSGKIVEDLSIKTVRHVYKRTKGSMIIIAVGGIFSAKDAYVRITAGANVVQLITGMIYQGPQSISEINQGLVRLLLQDGYKTVTEAVGKL